MKGACTCGAKAYRQNNWGSGFGECLVCGARLRINGFGDIMEVIS